VKYTRVGRTTANCVIVFEREPTPQNTYLEIFSE
jgi:hypothetical protein